MLNTKLNRIMVNRYSLFLFHVSSRSLSFSLSGDSIAIFDRLCHLNDFVMGFSVDRKVCTCSALCMITNS